MENTTDECTEEEKQRGTVKFPAMNNCIDGIVPVHRIPRRSLHRDTVPAQIVP